MAENDEWDDDVDIGLKASWESILKEMESLGVVEVGRRIEHSDEDDEVVNKEMQGFSDASQQGYGACVYVRSEWRSGKITVKLLISKSRATSKEFVPFVENRLKEIRNNSDAGNWNYINAEKNPADLLTRWGITTLNLAESNLWWEGPTFLCAKEYQLPQIKDHDLSLEHSNELKRSKQVVLHNYTDIISINNVINCDKYSKFTRLVRITAWMLSLCGGALIKANKEKFKLANDNTEKDVMFFIEEKGLLRCRGRLVNAPLPVETISPILIDRDHSLTKLIIMDIHWYRLSVARAFAAVGIDNFGPLYVKNIYNNANERPVMNKMWLTWYTCASSRALVLDLVPRPDSSSFISSFRRFIWRRGCPDHIIADNGSNFVLRDTQTYISNLKINWHFNLPLGPWHEGFFERLVRSTKKLLRKDLRSTKLSFEEMQTVLYEIEYLTCLLIQPPLNHTQH
ncbi:uncharacterized protein LOC130636906 [Hydractinia symbiolongicarpus]|uniref:uncharacterized protein LOC130636906 n=1 Tax=Hydractinia symbiolongicarpus TaxID=13093 RepID=UPI00254C6D28|nr:uncharacterized protein LOC130636906 [Hydractinia symbiolongicarpus]